MPTQSDLQLQDWLTAECEYLAQRPIDGSIPLKQLWGEDTIELRAYQIYLARVLESRFGKITIPIQTGPSIRWGLKGDRFIVASGVG